MKNLYFRIKVVVIVLICSSVVCGKAQNFANLNFEAGLGSQISDYYPLPFFNLPNWNVNITGDQNGANPGGVFNGGLGDGTLTLDATYGYLIPPQGAPDLFTGGSIFPLDGDFSLALYVTGQPAPASISISQTGTIPSGQNSVSFLLADFGTFRLPPSQNSLNYFSLSINGQNVPLVVTSQNGQVLTVAGNISQWAGQQVTLSIANSISVVGSETEGVIYDVAFSPQVVAVPASSGIGLLSGALSLSVVFLNRRKLEVETK